MQRDRFHKNAHPDEINPRFIIKNGKLVESVRVSIIKQLLQVVVFTSEVFSNNHYAVEQLVRKVARN